MAANETATTDTVLTNAEIFETKVLGDKEEVLTPTPFIGETGEMFPRSENGKPYFLVGTSEFSMDGGYADNNTRICAVGFDEKKEALIAKRLKINTETGVGKPLKGMTIVKEQSLQPLYEGQEPVMVDGEIYEHPVLGCHYYSQYILRKAGARDILISAHSNTVEDEDVLG